MNTVFAVAKNKIKPISYPPFRVGDKVRVHRRVKEGSKERIQIIEGEIIAHKHGQQPGATITVRRVTLGVAVELVLPLYSPFTEKIKIVKRQKVRRAKLYYLRQTKGKKGRLKENIEKTKAMRDLQEAQKKEAEKMEKEQADKEIKDNKEEIKKEKTEKKVEEEDKVEAVEEKKE
jgi:large subunit ribosomal protein L19